MARHRAAGRHPRRPAAALVTAAALAALAALPSAARAQTTEFTPASVRFVQKRTTTVFPGLDDTSAAGVSAAAAARGNPAEAVGVEADRGRGWGGLDAEGRAQAERIGAAVQAALRGNGSSTSDSAGAAAAATAALAAAGLGPQQQDAGGAAGPTTNATPTASRAANRPAPGAATPSIRRAWRAVNAFDQVSAVGNPVPYSYDPPDQAFAVSARYAVSGVNTATRVYDAKTGAPLSPTLDYTALMGLPPYYGKSLSRPEGAPCGDIVVDPTTLYDPELKRWIQTIGRIGLDQDTCEQTGDFWLEVAVSKTASPLGTWSVYSIYSASNGQNGSPAVAGCEGGCFADFPRAQVDPNVLVVSTNNFAFDDAGNEVFVGTSVFAIEKFQLARNAEQIAVAEFSLITAGEWDGGAKLRTISPAYVPPRKISSGSSNRSSKHRRRDHKKKKGRDGPPPAWREPFLLLSHSLDDPYRLIRFALTGTRAMKGAVTQARLDALATALVITASPVALPAEPAIVQPSAFFRVAQQPSEGNFPYGQSLGYSSPGFLGAGDSRLLSSTVAAGRHLGVFATMSVQDGFTYYAVYLAQLDAKTGAVLRADVISDPLGHLTWPAVALDRRGRGAVVCIASSAELYMSGAAFPISVADDGAIGGRLLPLEGRGLLDTFTVYSLRPRSGDYSVAVIEAESGDLWGVTEYVAEMSCSLDEYQADRTCGGTRASNSNWWSGAFAMKL